MTSLFNKEVQIEPAVILMLIGVQILDFHRFTYTNPLIEKDHFVFGSQSLHRVRYLDINLEFDDLAQLSHRNVI